MTGVVVYLLRVFILSRVGEMGAGDVIPLTCCITVSA